MFLGEHEYSIDDKNRMAIPARYRTLVGDGLVVTRGFDACVMGIPMNVWRILADQVSGLPPSEPNTRTLQRLLFSAATECDLDKQGRILLPQTLRDYADVGTSSVVIVGVNKYFEIWSPQRWQERVTAMDSSNDHLFAQLTSIKI
jgi:MraZ protein